MPQIKKKRISYINAESPSASELLARKFLHCLHKIPFYWEDLIFLCIGSDRITGDSLGPLIGRELTRHKNNRYYVYGTPENPVHAMNLNDYLTEISSSHPFALTVAIDASLGYPHHQHHITVGRGAICPGAGAGKQLPMVGDIFITGIVATFENASHIRLQSLEFAPILHLADTISQGILMAAETKKGCRTRGTGVQRATRYSNNPGDYSIPYGTAKL